MEAVLFGTEAQRDKIPSASGIDITGTVVPFRDSVKLLGVTLDSVLTMDRHVTEVIRSCRYHTRALPDAVTCVVPRTRTCLGDRAFAVAGPRLWNALPISLRQSDLSLGQF